MKRPKLQKYKNLYIHNTSQYGAKEVKEIVKTAFISASKVAKKEKWLNRLNRTTYLHVGNGYRYKGRFCYGHYACYLLQGKFHKAAKLRGMDIVQVIHINIGNSERFPITSRYHKFKDMPEFEFKTWQEAMCGVVAHELGHNYYKGDKEGEYNCELIALDAVDFYRKAPLKPF